METVISPAKTSKIRKLKKEGIDCLFENKKNALVSMMKKKSIEELESTWKCSDKVAGESYKLYKNPDVSPRGCATRSLDRIQYQHMDVDSLGEEKFEYSEEHFRILSGLYGVPRPFNQISKYRLDSENKFTSLYEFWGDKIRNHPESEEVINLISKEYG